MSSPHASHSKDMDTVLGGTTSESPNADGAESEIVTNLSDRLASLKNGGGGEETRVDAEQNEDTSITSNKQESVEGVGQMNEYVL